MKKGKLLIPMLFMCMVLTAVPAMKSNAEDAEGEQTSSELQDENSQSQESVTAMDENGNITEVGDSDGVVEDEGSNARARSSSPMIVNFNTKSNETTSYTEDGTGKAGYVNGDYGADAAYLGTSNGKVKFMMSGVIGWVDESEVQVISLDAVEVVSGYEVEDGRLLHCIVYDMTTPGYRSRLDNGEAPSYLTSGQKYYSYDGHYFYTDYETMISDYQNNTRSHSVNPDQPYYNYYQYLPLRSQTLYSGDSLNTMIAAKVSGSSKMSGTGRDFVNAQEAYGVNALLMVSIAGNESAWGTSSIASGKNNLFGLNAVDASPGESADTFSSVQACIEDFACGWMSQSYLDPSSSTYSGGFLGNKGSGLNVKYASDPYWGEKAANIAYNLDQAAGSQDCGSYTIGIKDTLASSHNTVNVRQESNTSSTVLYQTGTSANYAVLILDSNSTNGFYRIQSDAVLNADRTSVASAGEYSFDSMYAYISADYVTVVNTGTVSAEDPVTKTLQSIYIAAAPSKTEYSEGETFDPSGISVRAVWSDGTETDVSGEITYSQEALTTADTEVQLQYTSGGVTVSAVQSITVKAAADDETETNDPADTDEGSGTNDSADTSNGTGTNDSSGTSDGSGTNDSSDTSNGSETNDSADISDGSETNDSADVNSGSVTEAPSEANDGTDTKKAETASQEGQNSNVRQAAPRTGDTSSVGIWIALAAAAVIIIIATVVIKKRKK
ncbi:glucosaminidase domain-containing protein [Claveliimonas bilis]|uniref:glucosaminidase domain-containing protein n=1 Tax=Claveliimonas bilis TaxID=3028070 RepID=UPI00292FFBEB|nr:glucosaminidase domain-containing protein [Claveliimonas bilis]BDZ81308.1 hypothetical protein Lac3_25170 [Claveliimonas bilis]